VSRVLLGASALLFLAPLNAPAEQVAQRLAKAVRAGEPGEIMRQFNEAVYDHFAKMDESLPAIRPYLKDPSPFVRYTAARCLYVAGDRSGYGTLVDLVRSPEPVLVRYDVPKEVLEAAGTNEEDVRISAATVLGKYRQRESAEAVNLLMDRTPKAGFELRKALLTMGVKVVPPDTARFYASKWSITTYGLVGARRFVPDLIATFEHPRPPDLAMTPEIKVIAAWALAELTGEDRWVDYLVTAAKDALTPDAGGHLNYVNVTTALEYLGCLQHPAATPVLEDALDAPDFSAVEVALVNLLFNQKRGSEKARQFLIRQLRGERPRMQMRIMLDVASSFDDAEIDAAGRAFDRGSQDEWHRTAVERRKWPIYNWIDDYVVRLNGVREGVRPERVLLGD
jgi:HEAT repeat protein